MVLFKVGNVSQNLLHEGHGVRTIHFTSVEDLIGAEIARLVSFTFTLQFIARIHPDLNAGPPPPLNPESVLSSPPPPTIKDFEIVQGLVSVLCEAYGQEMRKFVVLAGKSLEYLRKMFSCMGGIGRQNVEKSWANASDESFILFNNDNSD